MNSMRNKVQLIGNLGMDPQARTTQNGKQWTRFSLATSESFQNADGEKVKDTQWHNLVLWGKMAEIACKYLKKGNEVAVEGKLISRSYNDKNGDKKYVTEVEVQELLMLGKKN